MNSLPLIRTTYLKPLIATFTLFFTHFHLQAQDACTSFGWANFDGQTEIGPVTGGGDAPPVEVSSFNELKSAVESSGERVIHVMNDMGNGYVGTSGDVLKFKSDKTVIGMKPELTVKCSFQISGVSNIIIKNLIIRGPGNSNSSQNWDAVTIQQGAKRIWFDHCTVMEGEDGNFDVVKGADNVTASWCKFTYVSGGEHNLSNLVGSSNNESQSHGKLNITYAYCCWDNVHSRCPRTRYGKIHVLNCYYNNIGSGIFAGKMSNIRAEGCFFESNVNSPTGLISTDGEAGVFVIDCNRGDTKTDGYNTVFEPPYEYTAFDHSEVKDMVSEQAGATLTDPTPCETTHTVPQVNRSTSEPSYTILSVNNHITVDVNRKPGDQVSMKLLDLSGRILNETKRTTTGSKSTSFDVTHLTSGVYILKCTTGNRIITRNFLKHK